MENDTTDAQLFLVLFTYKISCSRFTAFGFSGFCHFTKFRVRVVPTKGLVHTFPSLFENGDFFFLRFGHPVKTVTYFQNALQSGDFWKRWLLFYLWTVKKGGFGKRWCHKSYAATITHAPWGMLPYFHRFSVFVWTGENHSNTLHMDAFSKIFGYLWMGPKWIIMLVSLCHYTAITSFCTVGFLKFV